jgi:hypothetical protein
MSGGILEIVRKRLGDRSSVEEKLADARRLHKELAEKRLSSKQHRETVIDETVDGVLLTWLDRELDRYGSAEQPLDVRMTNGIPLVAFWAAAAGGADGLRKRWKAHVAAAGLPDVDLAKLERDEAATVADIAKLTDELETIDREREDLRRELEGPKPKRQLSYAEMEEEDLAREAEAEARREASA